MGDYKAFENYYQRKRTFEGIEYTAQFNGLGYALDMFDDSYADDGSRVLNKKFAKKMLSEVIVNPSGLSANSFSDMDTLNEVLKFAREVATGKFRDKENKPVGKAAQSKE